jgi:hypothetical protein
MLDDRNLIRRLIAEIRAFLDGQKKQIETITEYAKAQDKTTEPQPAREPERVRNEVDFPPEVINRYYSEQDKTYRLHKRTFGVSLITLIGLVVYTVYTIKMYHANKEAADAAKYAAETASKALMAGIKATEIDERAWLNMASPPATINIGQPIYAPIAVLNYGKTPALHVSGFVFVHLLKRGTLPDFTFVPEENMGKRVQYPHWDGSIILHIRFPVTDPKQVEQSVVAVDPLIPQPRDTSILTPVIATPELVRDLSDPTENRSWLGIVTRPGLLACLRCTWEPVLLVNRKTALLQRSNDHARLQVREFWRHPSLDSDS